MCIGRNENWPVRQMIENAGSVEKKPARFIRVLKDLRDGSAVGREGNGADDALTCTGPTAF